MTLALLIVLAAAPVSEAQARYEAGDFEGALKLLDVAVRTQPTGALHMARARCLNALRRNAEVDPAFEAALIADPTVTANDDDSPGFRATFDRIRARLAGTLNVQSDPPGAAVRLDGAMVGRAPVSQLLPVGRYRVAILDDTGAEADTRDVVVAARQTQSVTLKGKAIVAVAAPAPVPVDPHWPVVPTVTLRVLADPRAGAALEAGLGILARYVAAELDVVSGAVPGGTLRVGPRLAFLDGWISAQATLDGVAFFAPASPILGGGATLAFCVHPFPAVDVALEGSARVVQPSAAFHREYGLVGLSVRVRWPNRLREASAD